MREKHESGIVVNYHKGVKGGTESVADNEGVESSEDRY